MVLSGIGLSPPWLLLGQAYLMPRGNRQMMVLVVFITSIDPIWLLIELKQKGFSCRERRSSWARVKYLIPLGPGGCGCRLSPKHLNKNKWDQQSQKAARFISCDIKAQNVELHFSGSFALHPQIRPAILSSRRSATHTSRKSFNQDNGC
jgi:hypothetical protein